MQVTIQGHIYYDTSRHADAKWTFHVLDMRQWEPQHRCGRVWVQEHSFAVDVPDDFDPRADQISTLREEQRRVRAEFAKRIRDLDDQINSLLAIENCVEVAVEEPA